MTEETGLIHIYCGDGKGKTTAAVGMAVRCAGGGGKVLFFQFMKGNTSGELAVLNEIPNVTVLSGYGSIKFSFDMDESEKAAAKKYYENRFREITGIARKQYFQMLILDEIFPAITCGLIGKAEVLDFLKSKPEHLEVVLTGRDPPPEFFTLADYISEIRKIKHPFDRGVPARKLIEK